jgi:hypothetical protein
MFAKPCQCAHAPNPALPWSAAARYAGWLAGVRLIQLHPHDSLAAAWARHSRRQHPRPLSSTFFAVSNQLTIADFLTDIGFCLASWSVVPHPHNCWHCSALVHVFTPRVCRQTPRALRM